MMRVSILAAVVAGLALAQTTPKLVVFQLEPIGTEARISQVVTLLIKEAFARTQKYALIDPPETVRCYRPAPACSVGRELGADKVLTGSLMQLGNKYTVSFQLSNVTDGRAELTDRISTTQVEEMDVVADRIVSAVVENRPIEKTVEVGKVVESEVPAFKTRQPHGFLTLRTGYVYRSYSPNSPHRALTLEGSVAYELKEIMTEALVGGGIGGDGGGLHFDLLVHKLFSKRDISPYLGGGIGVHWIASENGGESGDGLAVLLSGGIMAFRTYGFRILANGRAGVAFTNDLGTVPEYGLTFGLASPALGTGRASHYETLGLCVGGCIGACLLSLVAISVW